MLAVEFPGSAHVREFGLARGADSVVWVHAAAEGFIIASKDVDFQHRALLSGPPPKVIWIRLGNCLTASAAALLRSNHAKLLAFEADSAGVVHRTGITPASGAVGRWH